MGFCVIFNSEDLIGLFANFFLDLLDIEVVLLWLKFRSDPRSFE